MLALAALVVSLMGVTGTPSVSADTTVGGIISEDTTWTAENSPYEITETLQIPSGVTLIIEPGVTISKPSSGDMFLLMGTICAHGTSQEPIVIDGGGNSKIIYTQPGYGYGDFQYCTLQNGYEFWDRWGRLDLRYSRLVNLSTGGTYKGLPHDYIIALDGPSGESNIEFNEFVNTGGIYSYNDKYGTNIRYNLFQGLLSPLTHMGGGTSSYPPKQMIVKYNSFIDTKGLALSLAPGFIGFGPSINGTENYWGTHDTNIIDQMIYDRNDDIRIENYIDYLPILTEPHPDTPLVTFDPWFYDENEDGVISKTEALTAVADYFAGSITKHQALEVIVLYFATPTHTLKVQSAYPAGFTEGYRTFHIWAETISEASNGRLHIQPYPAEAVVGTFDVFDAVESGVVLDGFVSWPQYWPGKHALAVYLSSYPFALDEPYMWETWFHQRGGIDLARQDYARFNMYYVGPVQTGPSYGHCVKPLTKFEDWKGLHCRYPGGMIAEIYEKAGASAIVLPGDEIYMAMAIGVIDFGAYMGHAANKELGLHEVGKYIIGPAQMHEPVGLQAFVINMDAWNSLPADLQQLLAAGVSDLSSSTFSALQAADAWALNWMVNEYGCVYLELPAEERAKFRKVSVELWKKWAKDDISMRAVESQILLMEEVGLLDFPGIKEEVEKYFPGLLVQ